ncbi:protein of unknown function [Petrocella atlantisensis]|uniref:Uncharacterized protein n=1 Tax=Petrocella atlantisensis TaxID=2173034 RepID=A0A3P7RWU3_9FIRM|nr:protein of unknown function [Petrocella atlantisensis]
MYLSSNILYLSAELMEKYQLLTKVLISHIKKRLVLSLKDQSQRNILIY